MKDLSIVILAAGHGTRMNSKTPKILHQVGGRAMIEHIFLTAEAAAGSPPVLVVAPGDQAVRDLFGGRAIYVEQGERLGTGHATRMAAPVLEGKARQVLVINADLPLIRTETIRGLAHHHTESGATATILTVMGQATSTFGRVLRGPDGLVAEIVEVAEARRRPDGAEILATPEHNVGVYSFDGDWLWERIPDLPLRQARGTGEYYVTDMIGLAVEAGLPVEGVVVEDADECIGAGTRAEMVAVEKAFRRRAAAHWLAQGVTIIDPEATYIDQTVHIGQDSVIWPGTYIQGDTTIGRDCVIGPNSIIREAQIGDGCRVEQAVVENATVPAGSQIEPFTHVKG